MLYSGNDKENDRMGYNSIMSDRALREVYLMPFMLAQKYAQPWSYMTAQVLPFSHEQMRLIRATATIE